MLAEIHARCNAVEECYEFMLAYAAQGLQTEEGSRAGGEIRAFLDRAVGALEGLAASCSTVVAQNRLEPAERYEAFVAVLDRDARDASAVLELVLAQPTISSQLIDNVNASSHVRALLTDLFLIGEIFRSQRAPARPVVTA
jgi:hypothetical protein